MKVNEVRVEEKRLDPGDIFSIAKHKYEVKYSPVELGAVGPPPPDVSNSDVFSRSLLKRAGLEKSPLIKPKPRSDRDQPARYDITDDSPGQIPRRHTAL